MELNKFGSGIFYKQKQKHNLIFLDKDEFIQKVNNIEDQDGFDFSRIEFFNITDSNFCEYLPYGCTSKYLSIRLQKTDQGYNYGPVNIQTILLGISQFNNLLHLQISINFSQVNSNQEYSFFKCIQKSFPQLESIDFNFNFVGNLFNDIFNRINSNIKKIVIQIHLKSDLKLQQFKNLKNVEHFSLTVHPHIIVEGFQYLSSILQTTKYLNLNLKKLSQSEDFKKFADSIEQSKTLEKISFIVQNFTAYDQKNWIRNIVDNIKKYPLSLKEFKICENKVTEEKLDAYIYHSEIFVKSLETLIPQLIVLKISMKGFQYNLNQLGNTYYQYQNEKEQILFPQLSKLLSRQNNLKKIDLRFGGSLRASEEEFRDFFNSLCIEGLESLTLDLERWKNAKRYFTQNQDQNLVYFFLRSLQETCSKSLATLRINFDGWSIFDNDKMIMNSLLGFSILKNAILMGPKNRILIRNYNLMRYECFVRQKKKFIYLLQVLKQYCNKNAMRVDYLLDIIYEFIQIENPQIIFNQEKDPFVKSINYDQAKYSVSRDICFQHYQQFNSMETIKYIKYG